jgi:hypothetical protein
MLLLNQSSISIKRYGTGSYSTTTGYYTAGTQTTVTQRGNIQPANADYIDKIKDIDLSGRDIKGLIQVFSYDPLYTVETSTSQKADIITYESKDYEIRHVAKWNGIGLQHYKGIGVLLP